MVVIGSFSASDTVIDTGTGTASDVVDSDADTDVANDVAGIVGTDLRVTFVLKLLLLIRRFICGEWIGVFVGVGNGKHCRILKKHKKKF